MINFISKYISEFLRWVDTGLIFHKPLSYLYKAISFLIWLVPISIVYFFFKTELYNQSGKIVFAFLIVLFGISLMTFVQFFFWNKRGKSVNDTIEFSNEFHTIPIVCNLIKTFGESVSLLVSIGGLLFTIIGVIIFSLFDVDRNILSYVPYLGKYLTPDYINLVYYPLLGYIILIFSRFVSEYIGVFAAIANNTLKGKLEHDTISKKNQNDSNVNRVEAKRDDIDFSKQISTIHAFFIKNIKAIFIVSSAIVAIILVYFLFLKPNPGRDATKVVANYCDCMKASQEKVKASQNFVEKKIDSKSFTSTLEINAAIDSISVAYEIGKSMCDADLQDKVKSIRAKNPSTEYLTTFDNTYNTQLNECNENAINDTKSNEFSTRLSEKARKFRSSEPDPELLLNDLKGQNISTFYFPYETSRYIKTPTIVWKSKIGNEVELLIDVKATISNEDLNFIIYRKYKLQTNLWQKISSGRVIYCGYEGDDIIEDNLPFVLNGSWQYPENVATYNKDGTWSTVYNNEKLSGTWLIKKGNFILKISNQDYGDFQLTKLSSTELKLESSNGNTYVANKIQ